MSNHVYDTAKIICCITCVIAQENGDTSSLSETELAKWERGVYTENVLSNGWRWSGVQCDDWEPEDDVHDDECARDGWFSWSWCEFCGDTNGGQRFNVAIMRKII